MHVVRIFLNLYKIGYHISSKFVNKNGIFVHIIYKSNMQLKKFNLMKEIGLVYDEYIRSLVLSSCDAHAIGDPRYRSVYRTCLCINNGPQEILFIFVFYYRSA